MDIKSVAAALLTTVVIVITLIYGQSLIIPFILSVLLWFIIKELREAAQEISWVKKHIPSGVLSVSACVLIGIVLTATGKILIHNIKNLSSSLPDYEKELQNIGLELEKYVGVDYKNTLSEYASSIDFAGIIELVINSLSDIISNAVLIILYLTFLLLEERVFQKKIKALYPEKEDYLRIKDILRKIDKSVGKYISLKTVVSLITGGLSYFALLFIGVDAAMFWAILIFLLNFIPNIGSLIGTLFPAFFALLQFNDLNQMFLVLGVVGAIQVIVGNVVEPKVMGDSLNLSALVVILSLTFWGAIWGVTGMILSVPITVGIVITCAAFPSTKKIAILLSENAEI
ncbi:AI-2E family transporter [Luteibaculum oceani]|uniref:AI-2E family transporter n=1 Tax=Luteibaculum oceani TaxID=1294296 RepID=A0A5C6UZ00_9FLAO|nr:AI-2E family transporter [Luteibaculum oceani]TXC76198.1 AI-2E family transporter [Luteibaculum oceani]